MPTPFFSDLGTLVTSTLSGQVIIAFSLTLLGAVAIGKLRSTAHRQDEKAKAAQPPSLPRELLLPVIHRDPDHIARADIVSEISGLILSGDWKAVADQISEWEEKLEATPAGTRSHDIAIETCLAALQNLIDEAPRDTIDALGGAEIAVEQLVAIHHAYPDNHILAVIAARAHLILAETCEADFWPEAERRNAYRKMAHHYLSAEGILNHFDAVTYMSPLVAGSTYRLAMGMPDGGSRMRPAFEDWIDLDPSDPLGMKRITTGESS